MGLPPPWAMLHDVTCTSPVHKYQNCVAVCPADAIYADTDVHTDEKRRIYSNEDEPQDTEIAMGCFPVLAN